MEQMLYTVSEVAKLLRCNTTMVYKLRREGLLPFLKLGQLKCRRQALEEFLQQYEGYDVTEPGNVVPLPEFDKVERLRQGFAEKGEKECGT